MRAFLGVYDKTGIIEFARGLQELGWDLVSTTGTQRVLMGAGIRSGHFADLTGTAEILGGRVKTLHPAIHGGLLYRRGLPQDEAEVREHGCVPIDLVAASFYPFGEISRSSAVTRATLLDNIDIGGPAMIRAAAKNFPWVIPIIDASDYDLVLTALRNSGGAPEGVSQEMRWALAGKVFEHTSRYDRMIAEYLLQSRSEAR
jgi:phosphoribosylaminoimidazolecarboxamide formyltransferase/IMP cyclohydrolase